MARYGKMAAAAAAVALVLARHAHAYDAETGSLQATLAECGFDPGPVDALWGAKTARAAAARSRVSVWRTT